MRVIVVGAGVLGLSCAVRLLEAGHDVAVLARDLPLETTSSVAAALWYPYRADPPELVSGWSARTAEVLRRLATEPGTGVALRSGTELSRVPLADPWWAGAVPDLQRLNDPPAPYVDGWTFVSPVVEMPIYLAWLAAQVEERGGSITRMALAELPPGGDLVVNCSGLGARRLAQDPTMYPVRGQVVLVEQVGIDRWWLDESGPTYVVPRSRDVVVGGTDEEGDWSRTPSREVGAAILERATALVPELAGARVLRTRVGLRPARPTVRVERRDRVVHCYGAGGAGVTLSWGLAADVTQIVGGSTTR